MGGAHCGKDTGKREDPRADSDFGNAGSFPGKAGPGAGSVFLGRLRLVFAGFSHISLLPLGADHGCYMAAELPPSTVGGSCAAAEGGPDDSGGGPVSGRFYWTTSAAASVPEGFY